MEKAIFIYEDGSGFSPVCDYLNLYRKRRDEESLQNLLFMGDNLELLQRYGPVLEGSCIRPVEDDLFDFEMMPEKYAFCFSFEDSYVLLHQYSSSRSRAPIGELRQAREEMADVVARAKRNTTEDVPFRLTWAELRRDLFTIEERTLSNFRVTLRGELMAKRQELQASYFKMERLFGVNHRLLEELETGVAPLDLETVVLVLGQLGKEVTIQEM